MAVIFAEEVYFCKKLWTYSAENRVPLALCGSARLEIMSADCGQGRTLCKINEEKFCMSLQPSRQGGVAPVEQKVGRIR